MRNLSRLGLKLLGILLLYWALSDLCRVLADIPLLFIQWSPADKAALMRALRREGLASGILEFIVSGTIAAILLSRTEWIISRLKLPEEPEAASMMAPGEALRICLIVVGSVAVIKGVPGLVEGLVWIILLPHGLDLSSALPDKYGFVATGKAVELNSLCESAASTMQFILDWVLVVKSRNLASKALAL
jgi:hypothetical protein